MTTKNKEGWVFEIPKTITMDWVKKLLVHANNCGLENKEFGSIQIQGTDEKALVIESKPETTKDFLARIGKESLKEQEDGTHKDSIRPNPSTKQVTGRSGKDVHEDMPT